MSHTTEQDKQNSTQTPQADNLNQPQNAQQGTQTGAEIHSLDQRRGGARGTAAMDPETRKEVARKGGLAVSRNRSHMAEIGRKGGQAVSKNREHMAKIGRKGGAASRTGGDKPEGFDQGM